MKHLFVLGRNINLSVAELFSYFEKEGNKVMGYKILKNSILIDLKNKIEGRIVDNFGGVFCIGEIILEEDKKNIFNSLEKIELYSGKKNKLNYAIWDFSESFQDLEEYLKKRFRAEKLKATLKHMTGKIDLQEGEDFGIPSSKLIDEEFFIFDYMGKVLFGRINEKFDSDSIEKRDMGKPVRRESLAISPRLSKILINLSKVKKGETLLDPFCGIGGIVSEALLKEVKVIGIDKDKNAVLGAKQNLSWFKFNKNDYEILCGDSGTFEISGAQAIATEPDLGETLKKIPQRKEATSTLQKFEDLMIKVIRNFKSKVSGRVVFTSPYIRIGKKRVKCNIENILEKTGYKLIHEIPEYRESQVVGRVIYVIEKDS